jgi:polysaccharide biosynthesis protein PelG
MLPSFRRYWDLAAGSLAYNLGLWSDKWIMWFSPARETASTGMISCPDYDSAMFLAYLTLGPSLAAFTMTIETRFYEAHLKFYGEIAKHATYSRIEGNRRALVESLLEGARGYLVLQGSICVTVILLAPSIFEKLRINFGQLAIFRMGTLGAFFQGGFLFLLIVLSYFDLRRQMLYLQLLFLAANVSLTAVTLNWGVPYYGYGYVMASLVAFAAAFLTTARALEDLPYLTFVRNNDSVRS